MIHYLEAAGRCDKSHQHKTLEGRNEFGSRTRQAAEWPEKLDLQQSEVDSVDDEVYAAGDESRWGQTRT